MPEARIPLVPEAQVPDAARRLIPLLGQVPRSMRAYAYRPDVLAPFVDLEIALLAHGHVDVLLKARIGYAVSRQNACAYCSAHVGARLKRNGVDDAELACLITPEAQNEDPAADAALRYARRVASGTVADEDTEELARFFSAAQIAEITIAAGFYCFINRVHDALGLEIEDHFERVGAHRISPAEGAR